MGLRDYAQAVHELGFAHLISYEHVLGAVPERLPKDYAPYGIQDAFNEILTTFAFMAAAAPELGLATATDGPGGQADRAAQISSPPVVFGSA